MKKLGFLAVLVILATSIPAMGASITYSGTALSGLDYNSGGTGGVAEYVAATLTSPAYAYLYASDAAVAQPSVFAAVPGWNLSSIVASDDILSSNGGSPYLTLWLDDGVATDGWIEVLEMSGTTLDGSSAIHVVDWNGVAGTYWGDTLSQLDSIVYSATGTTFGSMEVDYVGVGIGDWPSDTDSASAEIASISVAQTPEPTSLLLLGSGLATMAGFYRKSRKTAR